MHRQLDTRTVADLRCRCTSPSILRCLATALAHLKADDYVHILHIRIKLPPTKGTQQERELQLGVNPDIVATPVLHQLNAIPQTAQSKHPRNLATNSGAPATAALTNQPDCMV